MREVVVFTDATQHPDYVRDFVRAYWNRWGVQSVLLYPREIPRLRVAEADAVIGRVGVAARYSVDFADMRAVAADLIARYRVLAVVPQAEPLVLQAAELADLLGTGGSSWQTMARFRDKYALKEFLRHSPSGPRINASARVSGVEDTMAFARENRIERFVLKPNDGCGNSQIGFFRADSAPTEVAEYFEANPHVDVLAEEFIEGAEYCVNGQVDMDARVVTYSVQECVHQSANGRWNLAGIGRMIPYATPTFQTASRYAEQVLSAAGLRSSPFHMEIKIGPEGPCLIEVGARLGGAGIPYDTKLAHGGRVDLFAEAARCYAELPGPSPQPDWSVYDSHTIWTVFGVAERDERVVTLQGVDEVEQLPEFVYWVRPPELGQKVTRTVDLTSSPWQVTLRAVGESQVRAAEQQVRQLISWNQIGEVKPRSLDKVLAGSAWVRRRLPLLAPLVAARPGPLAGS